MLKKKLNDSPFVNSSKLLKVVDHTEVITIRTLSIAYFFFDRFHTIEEILFKLTFSIQLFFGISG